jgi:hypothetical protein
MIPNQPTFVCYAAYKLTEQVKNFNYLGCDISYKYDDDLQNKLHKFQYMCGTIKRNLINKTRKYTQLKFIK